MQESRKAEQKSDPKVSGPAPLAAQHQARRRAKGREGKCAAEERSLTLVGSGGVRSPLFLQAAFRRGFRGEIRLYDVDPERQGLMHRIGLLLLQKEGMSQGEIRVTAAQGLEEALSGTDAVVVAIRPGGLRMRARDEQIAFSVGILGQETVGVCGIAMAWRTLPALIRIATEARRLGNDPWIFNFTNPVGITSLGLSLAGFRKTVGICDSANGALYAASQFLGLDPDTIRPETFGLNHLSWTRGLWQKDTNLLPDLLRDERFLKQYQDIFLDPALRQGGLFYNEYLYYYLWPSRALEHMSVCRPWRGEWLAGEESQLRKELTEDLEAGAGQRALERFVQYHARRSETYMAYARDGKWGCPTGEAAGAEGYAGVALDVLEADQLGTERVRVLVVPDPGKLPGLPEGAALEVSCRIQKDKLVPLAPTSIPADCRALLGQMAVCERLVAESILEESQAKLRQALEIHPLVGPGKAEACMRALPWTG